MIIVMRNGTTVEMPTHLEDQFLAWLHDDDSDAPFKAQWPITLPDGVQAQARLHCAHRGVVHEFEL